MFQVNNYMPIYMQPYIPIQIINHNNIINMDWCYDIYNNYNNNHYKVNSHYSDFYMNMLKSFEEDKESVSWKFLSCNPLAIEILEDNMDKIDWHYIQFNPMAQHIVEEINNNSDKKLYNK